MKNRNMIFDFTQCYPKRKEPGLEWHDCSAIGGSRLYCSRDAEEKIKALQNKMADPQVYSNGEKAKAVQQEISDCEKELEKLNSAWEIAAAEL